MRAVAGGWGEPVEGRRRDRGIAGAARLAQRGDGGGAAPHLEEQLRGAQRRQGVVRTLEALLKVASQGAVRLADCGKELRRATLQAQAVVR